MSCSRRRIAVDHALKGRKLQLVLLILLLLMMTANFSSNTALSSGSCQEL